MKITTFDLFWNLKSNNHGFNTYHDVIFDWKKITKSEPIEYKVSKYELSKILNNSDYKICHNFYWYDWWKIPSLINHKKDNIDTLLIDCLISFNKTHHNLKKSINNDPLEDAHTTFDVLEKNIIKFHNLPTNIKNNLFSLLADYEEYNDFFIFYSKVSKFKLVKLSNSKIIENIVTLLKSKNLLENKNILLLNKLISENNKFTNLSIGYLIMFIFSDTINIPEFIFKSNEWLIKKLREILNIFYSNISVSLNKNIISYLKEFTLNEIPSFRYSQWDSVKKWLDNKDFLTILSTWWWKSLIYQLPAWLVWSKLGHLTLVITPLKALIKDQIDWLRDRNFNEVNFLSWDQNWIEKDIIYNKIKSWETKILFITPEALRSERNLHLLENRYISRVVIDEAHTLILWWWEFRPDYYFIKTFINDLEKINLNRKINLTLLTATATVDVEEWLFKYFNNRNIELIKAKTILKNNIKWSVINIDNKEKKIDLLISKIKNIDIPNYPTIIFTSRIKSAIEIEKHIKSEWIPIRSFYAWMKINDKKEVQESFINWNLNLIVATKAFWMWIDKKNVRYVIHYDLPWNIEDYTQEIWRAWRDGKYSQNIIFYDKKEIEERVKILNFSWLKYYNVINFLKYVNLKSDDKKNVLSPRQIAIQSWIKTNNKNWVTDVKILLSFLENEEINWINILNRKYDNTYVLFNKIENKIVLDCNELIMKDKTLSIDEKTIAKKIVYKIIEEKKAIDLNKLEENFIEDLWEDFNFRKINIYQIKKIENKINSLKILSKSKDDIETDIILEAWNILKDDKYRNNIFSIFWKRVNNIVNFKEANSNASFYDKIKNYYLFKNYINEKKWVVSIKDNKILYDHYKKNSAMWKIILDFIYNEEKSYFEKQTLNINTLLFFIQENHKDDFTISELKETLFFLDRLWIIKVKNWLLVFLTRFTLHFEKTILNDIDKFKKYILKEEFKNNLINKLDEYKKVKINKLLALQKVVEILEHTNRDEYTRLTEYYFNTPLKIFAENQLKEKIIN